jgi:predicted Rdx family selenoprotein
MRSLRYILTGHCHTLDDCLHRNRSHSLRAVRAVMRVQDNVGDMMLVSQIVGTFTWQFDDATVVVERVYGGFPVDAPERRRQRQISRARVRLERDIEHLAAVGIRCIACDGGDVDADCFQCGPGNASGPMTAGV